MHPRISAGFQHTGRLALLVFVAWSMAAAGSAQAEQRPYRAIVTAQQAPVYSGPGSDFYACDTLPAETVVEVYREDDDGWCAIRPPAGSASWVFGRHVDWVGKDLGTVNKDGVVSRVGSKLVENREVVHVRLNKGESVRILDREQAGGQEWLKIEPPAGEFRWVRLSDIRAVAPIASTAPEATQQEAPQGALQAAFNQETGQHAEPTPADDQSDAAPITPTIADASEADNALAESAGLSPEFAGQVAALEMRLSSTVAEPHPRWQLGPLEREAETLLMNAQTVAEREAVKGCLARIDRFASIQRRYSRVAAGMPMAGPSNAAAAMGGPPATWPAGPFVSSRLTAAPALPGPTTFAPGATSGMPAGPPVPLAASLPAVAAPGAAPAPAAPFDASGVLKPVVSQRTDAPRYALVNDAGHVLSFVTPAPDVNLQPYVGYRVGVVGRRDFLPNYQRNHVTASRVAPLTGGLLR